MMFVFIYFFQLEAYVQLAEAQMQVQNREARNEVE